MNIQEKQKTVLRLKKGILPHKFQCQKNTTPQPSLERQAYKKRRHLEIIEEALSAVPAKQSVSTLTVSSQVDHEEASTSSSQIYAENIEMKNLCEAGCSASLSTENRMHVDKAVQVNSSASLYTENRIYVDKAVQVNSKNYYRSKGVNINFCAKKKNTATSPFKISKKTISTSPLKITHTSAKRVLCRDSDSIESVSSAQVTVLSSLSSEPDISSSQCSWAEEADSYTEAQFKSQMRTCTLVSIEMEPKMLIGLPKKSYYLIKLLSDNIPLPTVDILITLKKIKLNESVSILAMQFGYTQSTISRIFKKSVPVLAMKMKELIAWQTSAEVFKKLPIAFRARYSNVISIIDCLEIQIEKPTNAVYQSLTWSQYKKCNTLKYLISCTPDGLVTFISDGYGGRATDVMIVEDCSFLNYLQPGTAIMADRGFKDISHLLIKKNCTLIRPPSVSTATACTKEEVKQAKRIAALRINVERVISRLREFHILLPHACVDHHLVPVIDDIIIIACGLINMQDFLIKK